MSACTRCLGAGYIVYDPAVGNGAYACPSCAPPHLRASAIILDAMHTVRKLERLDALVALEMATNPRPTKPCGPEHAYPRKK
jgi:hypothetical protein